MKDEKMEKSDFQKLIFQRGLLKLQSLVTERVKLNFQIFLFFKFPGGQPGFFPQHDGETERDPRISCSDENSD